MLQLLYLYYYCSGMRMLLNLVRRIRTVRQMLGEENQENATPGLQMFAKVCHTNQKSFC